MRENKLTGIPVATTQGSGLNKLYILARYLLIESISFIPPPFSLKGGLMVSHPFLFGFGLPLNASVAHPIKIDKTMLYRYFF
jgi:hypothetical protein